TLTEFGRAITGGTDQLYVDAGVKQADGTYKFTKDSTITIDDTVLGETYPVNTDGGDKVIVNAEGKKLTLVSRGNALRAGIQTILKNNRKIDITADKLMINAENTKGMSRAYGIWFAGNSSTLDIHGDTEITSKANDWSYGVLLGRASKANFDGLKVSVSKEAKESAALKGTGKSVLSVNVQGETAGSRSVQLDGEVVTKYSFEEDYEGTQQTDGPSTINLALTTANSYWNGLSAYSYKDENDGDTITKEDHGNLNLWLKNGAVWTNEKYGKTEYAGFKGSYVTRLTGGSDVSHAGVIIQKDEKPISVENYSGHTTVIYKHEIKDDSTRENAALYGNKAASIIGGDLIITKAAEKSSITLRTDNDGLNLGSGVYTDRNLVSDTLDKLANKLYYTAHKEGERNLTGIVEIAEGLTGSAVSRKTGGVAYKEDGQGEYTYKLGEKPADSQSVTEYGKAILGSNDRDTMYIDAGVLKDGVYHFTKSETTIAIDGTVDKAEGERDLVEFGPWFSHLDAAISGSVPQYDEEGNEITYDPTTVVSNSVKMDLHGNKLNINAKYDQGAGQTGIAAIAAMNRVEAAGKVEINNAGAMNVNVKGSGMTAALFADGGGKLVIHNGGENQEEKILTLRGGSLYKNGGVGIKTMNGNIKAESGVNKHSEITIDGLVDVVADGKASADGYSSNEAVSAVASDINIGGGTIKAINGAWAAIRAYGEFTTPNYGIVNVNAANRTYVNEDGTAMGGTVKVHKVSDFDIGENRAVIEGDIVTNGGMGTKGQVNIGLRDKDSHWIGNYADTVGYGVTKGSFGAVNIKMKDGAFWKGFGNGSVNIEMTGKDTYWHGFSIVEKVQLSLKDGSTWYNAIT
ncbi:hypothetical protein, partial [Dialister invisus]